MSRRHLDNPVERLRRRIALRLDAEKHKPLALRLTQVTLANAIGVTKSTLNELLHGRAAEQGALARLDLIAEHLETSSVELIQPYDAQTMSLSAQEQEVIAFWRSWPAIVRGQVAMLLKYFGELLPEEIAHRERLLKFRHIDPVEMGPVDAAIDHAVANTRRKRQPSRSASPDVGHRSAGSVAAKGTHSGPPK